MTARTNHDQEAQISVGGSGGCYGRKVVAAVNDAAAMARQTR